MKTIKEWIEICKKVQPEIGQQWEANWNTSNANRISICLALKASFLWHNTPEGRYYWETIYNDMDKNPDKYTTQKRKLFNQV
jgi:hypothetical protein